MAKDPVRVLVTGAAEPIGYALVPMIARGVMLGPDQPVILHMLHIPAAAGSMNGVKMELVDAAFPLLKGVVATTDVAEAWSGVNIVVIVGGFPRQEGVEKKDLVSQNISIYKSLASALEKYAAVNCKVLIAANLANTNALILKEFAPSVPEKNVTCLTRLDHNRALGQISGRLNIQVSDVKNVIIWGNYLSTHYPDVNHATVTTPDGEKPVRELVADDAWLKSEFMTTVQQRGAAIIRARKRPSALSVASAACDHIRDWALGTPEGTWVSMGVRSDGSYNVPAGTFYSFPVTCRNGEWKIVEGVLDTVKIQSSLFLLKCQQLANKRRVVNLGAGLDAHMSESINSNKQSTANIKPKQLQKDNVALVESDSESIKCGEKEIQKDNAKRSSLQSRENKRLSIDIGELKSPIQRMKEALDLFAMVFNHHIECCPSELAQTRLSTSTQKMQEALDLVTMVFKKHRGCCPSELTQTRLCTASSSAGKKSKVRKWGKSQTAKVCKTDSDYSSSNDPDFVLERKKRRKKEKLFGPVRVLVTGAAGQIGYALVPMIARGVMLGPDQPVILHMLDIPPAAESLNGVKMELVDAAFPLLKDVMKLFVSSVVATTDVVEACTGVNIAVMVGGFPRKEGMERKDVMSKNVSIYKSRASALEKYAAANCKVLVVANPANTNALILKEFAPSIPEKNITCLTRLDHNRALGQISERLNIQVSDVKNVIIWGNHSSTQYPDVNHATVTTPAGEKPVRELVADDAWLNSEFITTVQQRGAAIIKARKLSSALSAASAACDHIRDWVLGTPEDTWVSMGVHSDGSYNVLAGLIYSFPVTCQNGEWKIVQGLPIDEFSRKKLDLTAEELSEEKALAYSCLS